MIRCKHRQNRDRLICPSSPASHPAPSRRGTEPARWMVQERFFHLSSLCLLLLALLRKRCGHGWIFLCDHHKWEADEKHDYETPPCLCCSFHRSTSYFPMPMLC